MDKEQVYDVEVNPLMAQIITICKRAGISCLCAFDISTEKNHGVMCTTCMPDENGEFPEEIRKAEDAVYRRPKFLEFTITTEPTGCSTPATYRRGQDDIKNSPGLIAGGGLKLDASDHAPAGQCSECRGRGTLGFHSLQEGFRRVPCPACEGTGKAPAAPSDTTGTGLGAEGGPL